MKGFGSNALSVEDVAAMYQTYLEKTYLLEWHHCGYLERWDDAEHGDVNSNENGFLDPFENEYTARVDVIRAANQKTHEQHEGSA